MNKEFIKLIFIFLVFTNVGWLGFEVYNARDLFVFSAESTIAKHTPVDYITQYKKSQDYYLPNTIGDYKAQDLKQNQDKTMYVAYYSKSKQESLENNPELIEIRLQNNLLETSRTRMGFEDLKSKYKVDIEQINTNNTSTVYIYLPLSNKTIFITYNNETISDIEIFIEEYLHSLKYDNKPSKIIISNTSPTPTINTTPTSTSTSTSETNININTQVTTPNSNPSPIYTPAPIQNLYTYCVSVTQPESAKSNKCYLKNDYDYLNSEISKYYSNKSYYEYNKRVYDMYKKSYENCSSEGCENLYEGPMENAAEGMGEYKEKYEHNEQNINSTVIKGISK